MNVGTLTQFLQHLAETIKATANGYLSGRELEQAAQQLQPFAMLDINAFAEFLGQCQQYAQAGAVAKPNSMDASKLAAAFEQLNQVRVGTPKTTSPKAILQEAQGSILAELTTLASQAGLTGKLKAEPKWLERQLTQLRVVDYVHAFRNLADHITDPTSFTQEMVTAEIDRLSTIIPAADWKVLAPEFGLPTSTKGAKGVLEVLFKLTGQRPAKAPTAKKAAKPKVDEAKVTIHADRLQALLERAKQEAELPEGDVHNELSTLDGLNAAELTMLMNQLRLVLVGKTKSDILKRIQMLLTAGKRTAEQTAQ